MSSTIAKQQNGMTMTRGDVKKAVKAAPNIVYPDHIRSTVFQDGQGLDATVILIVPSSGFPEQLTVHRPIGVTDCADGDWVVSRTADVPSLLARAKDPRQAAVDAARAANRQAYLLSKGLLQEIGGKIHYPGDSGMTRAGRLELADKALKEAIKSGKARPGAKRMEYLEGYYHAEEAIVRALATDEARAATLLGAEQTYRTMGGVLEDSPQIPAPGLKGKQPRDLGPFLAKSIVKVVGRGEGMQVSVVENPAPDPAAALEKAPSGEDPRVAELQATLAERDEEQKILAAELLRALSTHQELLEQVTHGMTKANLEKLQAALAGSMKSLGDLASGVEGLGHDSGI